MIKLKSYAKINLTLHVGSRLENGYHPISSVMQQIDLSDDIIVEKLPEDTIEINCSANIPTKQNLCYKAAKLMKDRYGIRDGVKISIEKRIPIGAGLGGGSSNAAATIIAIDNLFGLQLEKKELISIAREIGSDVPFFIIGVAALVEGTGENVTPLELPRLNIVLVYPEFEVSTKLAYGLWDKKGCSSKTINPNDLTDARTIAASLANDLQPVIFDTYEGLQDIRDELVKFGALNACLSGSGPSIYGIFDSEKTASEAAEKIEKENFTVVCTKTLLKV
ncbi:MAG TPA: 4-(cytidine 5'-diphospho)-2-C-methyl-D-erythritol kinase [Candidatus Nanoarchaeia archaeon]|nr:4-(cytidine 5'-diphospho)-2-C-methyl-D-erythritol kinase [Candidatus Nanoarchaeia archaeon]